MARTVEITVPSHETDELIEELSKLPQVAGIQLQRSASVKPPGDIVRLQVSNRTLHTVIRVLQERGLGVEQGTSYNLSEPVALVESKVSETLLVESTDSSWEEMHQVLARESNMTVNSLILLAVAGILATVGISTGAIHIVVAAMVIAPGFEPISRMALGLVAGGAALRRGASDTIKGYLALMLAAALVTALLPLLGQQPLSGGGTYLAPASLVDYWSTVSASSLLISLLAGTAGAILVAVNRNVLTAGVMIALALIPSAALVGAGIVAGEFEVAGGALVRWLIDVALVSIASLLVFFWKRATVQKRPSQI